MSVKTFQLGSVVSWFLLVPLLLVLLSVIVVLPTLQSSMHPLTKMSSYETPNDVYSVLHIRLLNFTNADGFAELATTWDVSYNILVNSSRQPPVFLLVETLPGWSGLSVPLKDYPSDNSTYFFKVDGNWVWADYRTWQFTYNSVLSFQWKPASFPIDTFESPVIYVWTNDTIYPSIELEAPPLTGFVVMVKPIGLAEPMKVYESMSIAQRMGIGLPSAQPFGFQIVIQRDTNSISLYLLYFYFILFFMYFIAAFSRLIGTEPEKKISILATLSISLVAFIWTLRQVAGSVTVIEGILMSELLGWLFLEILTNTDWSPLKNGFRKMFEKVTTFFKHTRKKIDGV